MTLSKRSKKKSSPPEELPDLAIDELKKDMEEAVSGKLKEEVPAPETNAPVTQETPQPEETPTTEPTQEEKTAQEAEPVQEEQVQDEQSSQEEASAEEPAQEEETEEEAVKGYKLDPNKSFFNNLLNELNERETDISKLNQWYKTRFPKGNALEEMKGYWQEKKDELILESVGKELKAKLDVQMKKLQRLEGEWQKIYFDLVTKEEEMKKQEKKLKEIVKEFTAVFRKKNNTKGNIKKDKKK
jgi:hypothetical protein